MCLQCSPMPQRDRRDDCAIDEYQRAAECGLDNSARDQSNHPKGIGGNGEEVHRGEEPWVGLNCTPKQQQGVAEKYNPEQSNEQRCIKAEPIAHRARGQGEENAAE